MTIINIVVGEKLVVCWIKLWYAVSRITCWGWNCITWTFTAQIIWSRHIVFTGKIITHWSDLFQIGIVSCNHCGITWAYFWCKWSGWSGYDYITCRSTRLSFHNTRRASFQTFAIVLRGPGNHYTGIQDVQFVFPFKQPCRFTENNSLG